MASSSRRTTSGRCWTTSSGPRATRSAGAWSTSISATSAVSPSRARCGSGRSSAPTGSDLQRAGLASQTLDVVVAPADLDAEPDHGGDVEAVPLAGQQDAHVAAHRVPCDDDRARPRAQQDLELARVCVVGVRGQAPGAAVASEVDEHAGAGPGGGQLAHAAPDLAGRAQPVEQQQGGRAGAVLLVPDRRLAAHAAHASPASAGITDLAKRSIEARTRSAWSAPKLTRMSRCVTPRP